MQLQSVKIGEPSEDKAEQRPIIGNLAVAFMSISSAVAG